MAKKLVGIVKLQLPAGKANPSPPVGPALGQHGVNLMEFCKAFNAATQDKMGMIIPVVISIYGDRSFTFILKTPPASFLIKQEIKKQKGSAVPNREKVGRLSEEQLRRIAEIKAPDLNAATVEGAMLTIQGSARSMGVDTDWNPEGGAK